jgi:hypothetical protein
MIQTVEVKMSMIVMWLKKTWMVALVSAFCFGAIPVASVFALEPFGSITPTPPTMQPSDRLERAWAKEKEIFNKLGLFFNNSDPIITKVQGLINKAKAKGKDTAALQSALDAFSEAVKQAEPIYQSIEGIVNSHQGFDENGNVTDQTQALAIVKDMREKFMEIRQLLLDHRKALRDAIKTFREGNKPSITPSPTQNSG